MQSDTPMTKDKATADWSQADANGVYWWRYDQSYTPEIVEVRDGEFYSIAESDPTSVSVGEFLGPITPDLFAEVARLRDGSAEGIARNVKLLLDRNAELRRALADYVKFSDEAALLLDQDKDAKCLKLLLAMAGRGPRYRHDVDAARAALSSEKEQRNAESASNLISRAKRR